MYPVTRMSPSCDAETSSISSSREDPLESENLSGTAAEADGVTGAETTEYDEEPIELVALTLKVYEVPSVRPSKTYLRDCTILVVCPVTPVGAVPEAESTSIV